MPSRRQAVGLALMLLGPGLALCPACSELSYVGRAETAYDQGRYLEVAESLARHEPDLDQLPMWKKARYGLYRGLALLQLGDPEEGRRWLHFARDVELKEATLTDDQRRALSAGLASLSTP